MQTLIKIFLGLLLLVGTAEARSINVVVGGLPVVAAPAGNSDAFGSDADPIASPWASAATAKDYIITSGGVATNSYTWASGCARYGSSSADTSQIVAKSGLSAHKFSVCTRMGASTDGYCAMFVTPSGSNWTGISIFKNGSWVWTGSGTWTIAADHTMKLSVSGTSTVSFTLSVDGTPLTVSTTDSSSPIGTGNPGFCLDSNSAASTANMDNWQDY